MRPALSVIEGFPLWKRGVGGFSNYVFLSIPCYLGRGVFIKSPLNSPFPKGEIKRRVEGGSYGGFNNAYCKVTCSKWLRCLRGHLVFQIRFNEWIEVAIHDGCDIARLLVRSMILDHLIGLKHQMASKTS